jgi:hypothetical protein
LDVACNVGKAVEKGTDDAGHAIEKGAHDTGHAIEKGTHDTGNTAEKAAHDTGNAIEKAFHDIGYNLTVHLKDAKPNYPPYHVVLQGDCPTIGKPDPPPAPAFPLPNDPPAPPPTEPGRLLSIDPAAVKYELPDMHSDETFKVYVTPDQSELVAYIMQNWDEKKYSIDWQNCVSLDRDVALPGPSRVFFRVSFFG